MAVSVIAADGSGDYTTLELWAAKKLLGTLSEPEIAEIKGTIVANVTVSSSLETTTANYVEIRPFTGQRHTGQLGTGARITNEASGKTGPVIDFGVRNYRITGLEIVSVTAARPISTSGAVASGHLLIDSCIVSGPGVGSSSSYLLTLSITNLNATLRNSIFIGKGRLADTRNAADVDIENCTFWQLDDELGIIADSDTDIRNTYVGRPSGTQNCFWSGASPTGANNASSDTSATARFGAGSVDSVSGASAFEDTSTYDFRLKSGSALIDAGATIGAVTEDIVGTARPQGSAYDIGAFEVAAAGGTAVSFSGTVPTQNLTQNSAMSALDLSTYFSGTETPFTYAVQTGALPAGLSLNSSTGVISGTPTATGTASIVVRATDQTPDTADTNSFDIVVASAATAISFTGTVPTQNLTEDAAMTSLDLTSYFSGSETPFTYAIQSGTLPTGLSLSSGVISGTPTQVGTFPIVVRGTDDATNTADTNSFNIVVASAVATVTVTDPLKNNTGTLWASETGIKASVLNATTLESVYEVTGLTTNGSGVLEAISNAALNAGDSYHVAIKLSDGSVGVTGPITAT